MRPERRVWVCQYKMRQYSPSPTCAQYLVCGEGASRPSHPPLEHLTQLEWPSQAAASTACIMLAVAAVLPYAHAMCAWHACVTVHACMPCMGGPSTCNFRTQSCRRFFSPPWSCPSNLNCSAQPPICTADHGSCGFGASRQVHDEYTKQGLHPVKEGFRNRV